MQRGLYLLPERHQTWADCVEAFVTPSDIAALRARVEALKAYGDDEIGKALARRDRDQYQFWQGWDAALQRVLAALSGEAETPDETPERICKCGDHIKASYYCIGCDIEVEAAEPRTAPAKDV